MGKDVMYLGNDNFEFDFEQAFPELPDGNIYAAVTGGVESTLLLFLLLSVYGHERVIACTYEFGDRRQWEWPKAHHVVKVLNCKQHVTAGFMKTFKPSDPTSAEIYFNRENKLFDHVRTDPKFVAGFTGKNTTTLDPEVITPTEQVHYLKYFNVHRPFLLMDKSHTIDLYYKLHVESLLADTHSCIQSGTTPCGSCHACYERIEAFDRLGRIDPAIYGQDYDSLVQKVRRYYARTRTGTTHLL
jgi:7-cyano-7-deazaguanine synthase in queuosine biosynthesis